MYLSKHSIELITFFTNNNCLSHIKTTKESDAILKTLYEEIHNGFAYVNKIKKKLGKHFYKLTIKNIVNIKDIPRPVTFPSNAFPEKIRKHIDEYSVTLLTYNYKLFEREITINFLIEEPPLESIIKSYNAYVDLMLVWLYIVNNNASLKCSNYLNIFIYHTSLLKILPATNIEILNENNVNTAFTRTCPVNSEIVIFRKEEWFKVFIHETFHNFALDFSDMDMTTSHNKILTLFPVNSDVNLFESYTECWARILNISFCSYQTLKNKNIDGFIVNVNNLMNIERIFYYFQVVKILNFMDLTYTNLYEDSAISKQLRNTLYKENTNVLAYYFIVLVLLNNYNHFLIWCKTNNDTLLQFKKTPASLNKFYKLIKQYYKNKDLLKNIVCMTQTYTKLSNNKTNNLDLLYLLNNLRMTICELR